MQEKALFKTLSSFPFGTRNRQQQRGEEQYHIWQHAVITIARIMKLTAIILLAFLHSSAGVYSQAITLSEKNAPLKKILTSIEKQSNYHFLYEDALLNDTKPVSIEVKNVTLEEVLELCFQNQPLTYKIVQNTIMLKRKISTNFNEPNKTVKVHGTVYNESGQPLSGANVTIKETGRGTITNAKGEFELLTPENSILIFSYIGFANEDLKAIEGKDMQVYLKVTKNELDKVVVQAYGTITQRLATGNIATVTAEEISEQPVANALQALQGRIAGLVITQTSGYASAPIKVEIRGRNSIDPNFTSDPLYIIDGVPLTISEAGGLSSYSTGSVGLTQNGLQSPAGGQSPFFSLNPNDIENISVLKDADATAIYGSRGANGVILITTKKGKAGKTRFEINAHQGITQVTKKWSLLNTKQYLIMRREAFKNDNILPTPSNAPDLTIWDTTRNTDWQKFNYGNTGYNSDAQLSLSGGDLRTTFQIGAGYFNQTQIISKSGSDSRADLHFNLNHKSLNQKFEISFTGAYAFSKSDMIYLTGSTLPPDAPPAYDANGNLNYAGWAPNRTLFPFINLGQPYTAKTDAVNSNLVVNYEIVKGLNFHTSVGYMMMYLNQLYLQPISSQDPLLNPTGSASFGYNLVKNWIYEPQLEYNRYLGNGKLNILLGVSSQNNITQGNVVSGTGYINDALIRSISNAVTKNASDVFAQYRYAAIFSRINYNWEDKYILNLSVRRDGSSRFGPGNQFGNFGAIGGAWLFTEEKWVKENLSFLSFGKIRSSYGITGSDLVGDYRYLTQWGPYIYTYLGNATLIPQLHSNPNFHWEVNKKIEVASDFGFLKDRISISAAYYRNNCNNQLVQYPTGAFTGFTYVTANSPANLENTGWEFLSSDKIINDKDFKWDIRFNLAINHNKLLSYPNLSQSPYGPYYIIGQSVNIRRLLHYTGVDPQTGQYTFEDKNHDGQITIDVSGKPDDRFVYDLSPKFSGGLGSNWTYKGWKFNIFFYFIKQRGINSLQGTNPGDMHNQPTYVLSRWQKPGDKTNVARFTTQPNDSDFDFNGYSDGVYSDASFIRLQNVYISYNLTKINTTNKVLKECNIYIQGQNLLTITKYKGLDPETQNFGGAPPVRILTIGLRANF